MITRFMAVAVVLTFALLIGAVGCASESQQSVPPVDFYKGKTINLIACASPGGQTDLETRVIASFLERDTGANVIVTNMKGAGGLDGMNYVYKSDPDGLTLGVVPIVKFVSNKMLDEPAAVYDIDSFPYIMLVRGSEHHFFVSPETPYKSIADLQAAKHLLIGATSPAGPISLGGLSVIELLDLDARVITGFSVASDLALAVKRGEIVGYVSNIPTVQSYLESGMVVPMFALATERDPLKPDVPAISELVSLSEDDLALVKLWETALASSDILVASPGTPPDRITFLSDLANKWIQYEDFREEINQVSGYEVQEYQTGDMVTEAMLNLTHNLDEFKAVFAEMIRKYRD